MLPIIDRENIEKAEEKNFSLNPVTEDEVFKLLSDIKVSKAVGPNRVRPNQSAA